MFTMTKTWELFLLQSETNSTDYANIYFYLRGYGKSLQISKR